MIQLSAGYLRAVGQRWQKTKYTWIKFSCRKYQCVRLLGWTGGTEATHNTGVYHTRAAPALPLGSVLLSAPLPKIIPHPAPATSPASLHPAPTPTHPLLSFPAVHHPLHLLDLCAQFAEALGAEAPPQRRPLPCFITAAHCEESYITADPRGTRVLFRWDSLSQCFPCYPLLPSSPGSRAPALLLLCVTVFRSHRGLDGSCTQVLSQIQAIEW